jgi:DNA polymerase-3 subunit epsilon
VSTLKIAVIDVETTGLSPWRHDRIVELAVVVVTPDGVVQQEYETLVNPERDMGPTRIHRIAAGDVVKAPRFREIAGDLVEILRGVQVIGGHNVSFDRNFLVKEYERHGVVLPELPLLCTCRHFGRNSLEACCREFGIDFEGAPHRALIDARATAKLITSLCSEEPSLLESFRHSVDHWPEIPALKTPCFPREQAVAASSQPPRFLQRLASLGHRDIEASQPEVIDYLCLIDRVLEDRVVDAEEEEELIDAASNLGLSTRQIDWAHLEYLRGIAAAALSDGIVSEMERRDLNNVAKLLGQGVEQVESMLEAASKQMAKARGGRTSPQTGRGDLAGQRVCFTGELLATLNGSPIRREIAEALASEAGLIVTSGVSKKLDILVVADPNTQSGKAKKAREYGIRILSEPVFWQMLGVSVD